MWTRKELKEKAKVAFKANYWTSVLAGIIVAFFTAGGASSAGRNASNSSSDQGTSFFDSLSSGEMAIIIAIASAIIIACILFAVLKIVVGNVLVVGATKVFIDNEAAQEKPDVKLVAFGFKSGKWGNLALTLFLKDLFIALWTLLLVIPGIIKGYEYMMVPYLLAEDPGMDRKEAFAESKRLMNGQKWNAFVLDLSFILWGLLSLLTCGVLSVFYVQPYVLQTKAELYLTLKANN